MVAQGRGTYVVQVGKLDLQRGDKRLGRGLHRHGDDFGVQHRRVPRGKRKPGLSLTKLRRESSAKLSVTQLIHPTNSPTPLPTHRKNGSVSVSSYEKCKDLTLSHSGAKKRR